MGETEKIEKNDSHLIINIILVMLVIQGWLTVLIYWQHLSNVSSLTGIFRTSLPKKILH